MSGVLIPTATNSEIFITVWKWTSLVCVKLSIRFCQSGNVTCVSFCIPQKGSEEMFPPKGGLGSPAAEAGASSCWG